MCSVNRLHGMLQLQFHVFFLCSLFFLLFSFFSLFLSSPLFLSFLFLSLPLLSSFFPLFSLPRLSSSFLLLSSPLLSSPLFLSSLFFFLPLLSSLLVLLLLISSLLFSSLLFSSLLFSSLPLQEMFLLLFLLVVACQAASPRWFSNSPLELLNPDAVCFDSKESNWGRDYALLEVPPKSGLTPSWDPDSQGKHRIGFYFSTGTSNQGLHNFQDAW